MRRNLQGPDRQYYDPNNPYGFQYSINGDQT